MNKIFRIEHCNNSNNVIDTVSFDDSYHLGRALQEYAVSIMSKAVDGDSFKISILDQENENGPY